MKGEEKGGEKGKKKEWDLQIGLAYSWCCSHKAKGTHHGLERGATDRFEYGGWGREGGKRRKKKEEKKKKKKK